MYLDTARHHIDMALQKLTIEWPKLPDEINAKTIEEFLTNPLAITMSVLLVWVMFILIALKFSSNRKKTSDDQESNSNDSNKYDGDKTDNNTKSNTSSKAEKDEYVRIFQSRINVLKESERQMDERIEKLEELLDENNGYQMWSNVLPVALSVIALIVSLRRGR